MVAVMRPLVIRASPSPMVICGAAGAGGSRAQSWLVSTARCRVARTRRLFSPHGSTQRISPPWRRTSRSPSWLRYCLLTTCYLPVKPDDSKDQTTEEKLCPGVGYLASLLWLQANQRFPGRGVEGDRLVVVDDAPASV